MSMNNHDVISEKKQNRIYLLILVLMAVFAMIFVSIMGYLNYRATAIELEGQVIARLETDTVDRLETALNFGKSFENYYGMDEVLESFSTQFPGPYPFIIRPDGTVLYRGDETNVPDAADRMARFLEDNDFSGNEGTGEDSGYTMLQSGREHAIFVPIHQEEQTVGYFGVIYSEAIFSGYFVRLEQDMALLTAVLAAVVALCLFLYVKQVKSRRWQIRHGENWTKIKERMTAILVMAVGIILLSILSITAFQRDYREKIETATRISLQGLESSIKHVKDEGVDLRTVPELDNYIEERVRSLNTLHAVRISERIAEVERTTEDSNLISFVFDSGHQDGQPLYLEAEISDDAMRGQILNIVLILLSTLVILLVFVFELNNIVELITAKMEARRAAGGFTEKQVSLSLRLTGFLCSTAEYMCVPYAAMMIRDSGQSLFGLSVGMTAALPLTLEGFTQMVAIAVLPKFVRRFNVKVTLMISSVVMILCNMGAFFSEGALMIILCRGIAGIAYGGFKQVSNYLITRGYDTEAGRSENISQDNAGLLAGATCGAGLGAILSANAGYPMTFLCSAVLFIVYMLVTFFILPWKMMESRTGREEASKPVRFGDIRKMILSPEMQFFILAIGIPLNIGVMLCVTLIPAICQTYGISSVLLSYCFIGNGLVGIYIGPSLVSRGKQRFGASLCIAFAFALTAVSIFILHIPPVAVMIILTSMILGFLDGFGTPLVTDKFMSLKVVRESVDESTALIFSVVLSSILLTVAPMIAELMVLPGKGFFTPMMAGAVVYLAAALLLLFFGREGHHRKEQENA